MRLFWIILTPIFLFHHVRKSLATDEEQLGRNGQTMQMKRERQRRKDEEWQEFKRKKRFHPFENENGKREFNSTKFLVRLFPPMHMCRFTVFDI